MIIALYQIYIEWHMGLVGSTFLHGELRGLLNPGEELTLEKALLLFKHFDHDRSATISLLDMRRVLMALGIAETAEHARDILEGLGLPGLREGETGPEQELNFSQFWSVLRGKRLELPRRPAASKVA
jgi:hypothetical protein